MPSLLCKPSPSQIAIIGGGPAGLMAAEVLSEAGLAVDVFDAMPSVGRKFLLAGIGGLNITHAEDYVRFCTRYGARPAALQAALDAFPPAALRDWVHGLGVDTFVGSSGRVFPTEMKAAPLLRAWLHRLRSAGVRFHMRHRWQGWNEQNELVFQTPTGPINYRAHSTLLALGGGSWPKLGSDGAWIPWLAERGVSIAPLQSANCGFEVAWSAHLRERFAGSPLKSVVLSLTDAQGHIEQRAGELVITASGVEGSLIYAVSRSLRETLSAKGQATFTLDLAPGYPPERVLSELRHPRGTRSLSSHLQSRLGLKGIKVALLHEVLGKEALARHEALAAAIKALPITVHATRPMDEVISTAGGVRFESLTDSLMLRALPGTFVAGEMLDWEAPTGGYLLTACLATGRHAGMGMREWVQACCEPS